ncbi:MAG: oxygenase MpaB family protein [Rhizobiaceae bacterium]
MTNEEIWAQVRSQASATPAVYGAVDFDSSPERFTAIPGEPNELQSAGDAVRNQILGDAGLIDRMRAYTFMGDRIADPYAALMPEYGFKQLVYMLSDACDRGIDAVSGAPPELRRFIEAMERVPDWLDMKLVEEGARAERAEVAVVSPFSLRAAFIATFMNKYSALPMAFTGTLSNESAARRVKETATFFATSVLPGALARNGAGFKAAAMVRLMHSMVRFNVMRKGRWDVSVYGIPIPQVDQMPAGLIGITLMAQRIIEAGRESFAPAERARVELSRYRCYLLGLPETLLATEPMEILTLMGARQATLRSEFDDQICGDLVRATMGAYLPADRSWRSRLFDSFERGFSKLLFVKQFVGGDMTRAREMGIGVGGFDRLAYGLCATIIAVRLGVYKLAARLPLVAGAADRRIVATIERQLASYGHAHFTTDASAYRPAAKPEEAVGR